MLLLAFQMAKICLREECKNPQFGGGYCKWDQHLREDKKKPAPIKSRADKKRAIDRVYFHLREVFLALPENWFCKIKAPGCTGKATEVHHTLGKILHYLNVRTWLPACRGCNQWAEANHSEAEKMGVKGSKFTTTTEP